MVKRAFLMLLITAQAASLLLIVPIASGQDPVWPVNEWTYSSPEAQGVASEAVADYLLALSAPGMDIDSVMIVRHGQIIAEAYYAPSTADTRFSVYSATKSMTSALFGIAIEQGHIASLDEPVLSFFPDVAVADLDTRIQAMTLRDLLTLASGFECDESMGINPDGEVMAAENWLQAAFEVPMMGAPGTEWHYCNLNFNLLAAVLEASTGQSAFEYARVNVFEPLGITDVAWATTPTGGNNGAAGLQISLRDLARFGYLYLHGGAWNGVQVVPAQWVSDSLASQIPTPFGVGYGYGWWIFEGLGGMALGDGGQYIFVLPSLDVVLVATGHATEATRTNHQLGAIFGGLMNMPFSPEPLPDNPEDAARLATAVEALASPTPAGAPPLPDMAAQIDETMYGLFGTDLLTLEPIMEGVIPGLNVSLWDTQALSLAFPGGAEATLALAFTDGEELTIPVGLDGVYRVSEGRLGAIGARGEWLTDHTFRVYLMPIGSGLLHRLDMTFNGEILEIIAFEVHTGKVKAVFGAVAE